jgi:hypothetical protein
MFLNIQGKLPRFNMTGNICKCFNVFTSDKKICLTNLIVLLCCYIRNKFAFSSRKEILRYNSLDNVKKILYWLVHMWSFIVFSSQRAFFVYFFILIRS